MSYHTPEGFRPIYRDPMLDHQIVINGAFFSCNCLRTWQQYKPIGPVTTVPEMKIEFDKPSNHRKPFDPAKHALGVRPENQP